MTEVGNPFANALIQDKARTHRNPSIIEFLKAPSSFAEWAISSKGRRVPRCLGLARRDSNNICQARQEGTINAVDRELVPTLAIGLR